MKERVIWIDIAKAIGIYLVVVGHALDINIQVESDIRNFIYIFHMPLFFFLSGYLFKDLDVALGGVICKNVNSLIVPYIFLNFVAFLLWLPIYIHGQHDIPVIIIRFLIGDAHSPAGPAWFLLCLFWVRMAAYFLIKTHKAIQIVILSLSMIVAYLFPYRLYWCLDSAAMALPFYLLGYYVKSMSLIRCIEKYIFIFFFTTLFLTICISILQDSTAVYSRLMGNYPLLYYPGAFIGIVMIVSGCLLFNSISGFTMSIATSSIVIMGLHGCFYSYLSFLCSIVFPATIRGSWLYPVCLSLMTLFVMYYPNIIIRKYFPSFIGYR